MKRSICHIVLGALVILFASCRKEMSPLQQEQELVFSGDPAAVVKGMYVLNEGNMNSNKASLDYVDFTTGTYTRNLYAQVNPDVPKGLGDVGNDIGVYGSRLYVVVNNSNKVEVMDLHTCRRIGQIDIINCRYICFYGGKAYVSAYLARVGDAGATNGIVAEVDTATLAITRQVNVGRQPEGLAVVGDKLYVANSGGYSPPHYENTVSVVTLSDFAEIKRIAVDINLHHVRAAEGGALYVSSRGDYYDIPSKLYQIDTQHDSVIRSFPVAVSDFWIDGHELFAYSNAWNYDQGKRTINYNALSLDTEAGISRLFITDGTDRNIAVPYGIAVNPVTKDIFVSDAKDYVTPGTLYCFDASGNRKWSVTTGDMPVRFAFVY